MNEIRIITSYVVTDNLMKKFGHQSHLLAQVSDAEVICIAIVAALYFQNNHERALCVMRKMGYITGRLSVPRFNKRLHQLAHWLKGILVILYDLFRVGEMTFVIDNMPVPVCKRARSGRCRKVRGAQNTVGIAPLRKRSSLAGACI